MANCNSCSWPYNGCILFRKFNIISAFNARIKSFTNNYGVLRQSFKYNSNTRKVFVTIPLHDSKLSAMGGIGYTLKKAAAGKPGGDFNNIVDIKN